MFQRSLQDDLLHYRLFFNNRTYHLQLEPNVRLTSPGMLIEKRSVSNLSQTQINPPKKHLCQYTGKIKGVQKSRVALSVCDGLVSRDNLIPS